MLATVPIGHLRASSASRSKGDASLPSVSPMKKSDGLQMIDTRHNSITHRSMSKDILAKHHSASGILKFMAMLHKHLHWSVMNPILRLIQTMCQLRKSAQQSRVFDKLKAFCFCLITAAAVVELRAESFHLQSQLPNHGRVAVECQSCLPSSISGLKRSPLSAAPLVCCPSKSAKPSSHLVCVWLTTTSTSSLAQVSQSPLGRRLRRARRAFHRSHLQG